MTKAETREWIVAWLCRELTVDRSAVDGASNFADLGIGSRQAVMLAADLEGALGRELPPNLLWESPSLDVLVDRLA